MSVGEATDADKGIVVVFPGSWENVPPPGEGYSNWDPYSEELKKLGYSALVLYSLPTQNRHAARSDYYRAAADEIRSRATGPVKLLLGYSGGGLNVDGTRHQLYDDGFDTDGLKILFLTASLGKPGSASPNPFQAAIPEQRNTEYFRERVKLSDDGSRTMEERHARKLLFGRVPRKAARLALKNMRPQYLPTDDQPLPSHASHDTIYVWDPKDPVRNGAWVRAVCLALGYRIVELRRAGHAIHLSRPRGLAALTAEFIEQSNDDIATVGRIIPRQLQRKLREEFGPLQAPPML